MTLEMGALNVESPRSRTPTAPHDPIKKGEIVSCRSDRNTPHWMKSLEHRYWKLHDKIYSYGEKPLKCIRQEAKPDVSSGRSKLHYLKKARSVGNWQRLRFDKYSSKCHEILSKNEISTNGKPSTTDVGAIETNDKFSSRKKESDSSYDKAVKASSSLGVALKSRRLTYNDSFEENVSHSMYLPSRNSESTRSLVKLKHFCNTSSNSKTVFPIHSCSSSCELRNASARKPLVLSRMSIEAKRAIVDIESSKESDSSNDLVLPPGLHASTTTVTSNERHYGNERNRDGRTNETQAGIESFNKTCDVRDIDETCKSRPSQGRSKGNTADVKVTEVMIRDGNSQQPRNENETQQRRHFPGSKICHGENRCLNLPSKNDEEFVTTRPSSNRTFEITGKDYDSRFHISTTDNCGVELADVHDKAFIKCMNWLNKYNPKPELDIHETVKISTVVL